MSIVNKMLINLQSLGTKYSTEIDFFVDVRIALTPPPPTVTFCHTFLNPLPHTSGRRLWTPPYWNFVQSNLDMDGTSFLPSCLATFHRKELRRSSWIEQLLKMCQQYFFPSEAVQNRGNNLCYPSFKKLRYNITNWCILSRFYCSNRSLNRDCTHGQNEKTERATLPLAISLNGEPSVFYFRIFCYIKYRWR